MFSFFKRKKSDEVPEPTNAATDKTANMPRLPKISGDRIAASVKEILDGKYTNAQLLLENFFYVNADLQKYISQALFQTLSSLTAKKWYYFSDQCRGSLYYSHSNYLMPRGISQADLTRENYPHLSDEEYSALLCIGTFHYDGFFREKCLRSLAGYNGYLRYYYIRMNDRVHEIRLCSGDILKEILPKCPLYDIVRDTPILEKLHFTKRRSEKNLGEIVSIICERIKKELNTEHIRKLIGEEPNIRNSFYKFGCQNSLFSKEILEFIIEHEPFGNSKERMLMHKFGRFGCSGEEYEKYIHHKCPNVRYIALLKRYEEINNSWEGLETLLTDKASKVRALAAFIFKKYKGLDERNYYLGLLGTEHTATALTDLGIYGTKADAETIKSFITSDNSAIARQALHSYGKLMGTDGSDIYWKYLCSDDIRMSREAYRVIMSNRIIYPIESVWAEYQKRMDVPNGKFFLYLLCNRTDWERMKYLVKLYADDSLDETIKDKICFSLHRRNMYKKLSAETADELISVIDKHKDKLGKLADELVFDISKARE